MQSHCVINTVFSKRGIETSNERDYCLQWMNVRTRWFGCNKIRWIVIFFFSKLYSTYIPPWWREIKSNNRVCLLHFLEHLQLLPIFALKFDLLNLFTWKLHHVVSWWIYNEGLKIWRSFWQPGSFSASFYSFWLEYILEIVPS